MSGTVVLTRRCIEHENEKGQLGSTSVSVAPIEIRGILCNCYSFATITGRPVSRHMRYSIKIRCMYIFRIRVRPTFEHAELPTLVSYRRKFFPCLCARESRICFAFAGPVKLWQVPLYHHFSACVARMTRGALFRSGEVPSRNGKLSVHKSSTDSLHPRSCCPCPRHAGNFGTKTKALCLRTASAHLFHVAG